MNRKNLQAFIIKEFKHIFRDKRSLIVIIVIPVILLLAFGYAIKNEVKNAGIAVLDLSKDQATQTIIEKLQSSGYFILMNNLKSYEEIEKVFKKGNVKEVIVFEPEFDKKLTKNRQASVQLIADATDANTASLIVFYTSSIIQSYVNDINKNIDIPFKIDVQERMLYNEELHSSYTFVPGTMGLILILISAMMTSISIAREKEIGTMEILLISPLKPIEIVLGKLIPYFILSFINAITIISIGYFVFHVPILGNLLLLLAETMLYILLALSIGLFVSTVAQTQQAAMMASMFALMLPTTLLSGFIYPIKSMPQWLQLICNLMPAKWYIIIIKAIMLKGVGLSFIWKETLILVVMTLFFIALSVKKFKIRIE